MPQSSDNKSALGVWPGFLVALLLGVGAIWVQAPFKSERPPEAKGGLPSLGVQDVDARLWQDPFAAAAEVRKDSKPADDACKSVGVCEDGKGLLVHLCQKKDQASGHDIVQLSRQVKDASSEGSPLLTILAVMVSGGPSIGAAESRRRYRYATLSALMLENFFPDDDEHVGYVNLGSLAPPEYMPFEWFSRTYPDQPKQALLLLWLDDIGFRFPKWTDRESDESAAGALRPLARLSKLLTNLYPRDTGAPPPAISRRIAFEIIGPASSTTLQAMAKEPRDFAISIPLDPSSDTTVVARMWSPIATIPDAEALMGEKPLAVCHEKNPPGVCIQPPGVRDSARTIATDDVLAEMLVQELAHRKVDGEAGVALVGQLDTAYSRSLANLFEGEWKKKNSSAAAGGRPSNIKRFSYLRGLDGQIPDAKPNDEGDADDAHKAKDIERPHGDAQIDYLRRMRDELLAEDARLRRECGLRERFQQRCGLRAIGVLGDDYYDKLLVLQALKPVFPGVVFFTTDLDAAMLHPRDNLYTRNLIVASGFGLTLKKEWQGGIPPLRNSYQTAMVLAVRMAVQSASGKTPSVEIPPSARLFEIGRTKPVELVTSAWDRPFLRQVASPGSAARVKPEFDPHPDEDLSEHFAIPSSMPYVLVIFAAVGLVVALTDGAVRGWLAPRHCRRRPMPVGVFYALLFAVVTVVFLIFVYWDVRDGGEPLSLFEGVSIWPSEALRLAGGFLALVFLVRGYGRQQRAYREIEAEFPGLAEKCDSQSDLSHRDQGTASAGSSPGAEQGAAIPDDYVGCSSPLVSEKGKNRRPAAEIWANHLDKCSFRATSWRVLVQVIFFFLFAQLLMLALGFPNHPTRSPISWWLDLSVILLVLFPFLLLLFFIAYATRQTLSLAKELEKPVFWPASALNAVGLSGWGERPGDAADRCGLGADLVWLDVKLIAGVSKPVGDLVWYPILVLVLFALARHPWLDAWTLPPSLLLVMLFAVVLAIACALLLRCAAERVREQAKKDLTAALLRAQGRKDTDACRNRIETLLREVAAMREGAFRPFSQQPVVQALLTLASSVSGLALLEYASVFSL